MLRLELDELESKRAEALRRAKDARKRLRRWQTIFDQHMDKAIATQDAIDRIYADANKAAKRLQRSTKSLQEK